MFDVLFFVIKLAGRVAGDGEATAAGLIFVMAATNRRGAAVAGDV